MRLLKLAATSSLAALLLSLGGVQLKADHEGWMGFSRSDQNFSGQTWAPRAPAQRTQPQRAQPQRAQPPRASGDTFFNWFQPQPRAEVPRSQNIEPEAPPATAPVVYTYRAEPMVELADSQLASPRSGNQASHAIFEALKSGTSGARVTEQQRDDIIAFYRARDFAPVWVTAGGQWDRADDLLTTLADADAHAMVAEDYLPSQMATFSDDLTGLAGGDQERLARLDLALTAVALRYAMHASGGRLIPNRLSASHDLKPPTVNGREALGRLANESSPGAYLETLHPVHPAYEAFRQALADLSAQDDTDRVPIADGPVVRPGDTDPRIPAIRDRLARLGHLEPGSRVEAASHDDVAVSHDDVAAPISIASNTPIFGNYEMVVKVEAVAPELRSEAPRRASAPSATPPRSTPSVSQVLDAETEEALRAFQAVAGITVDGIIGQQTISALNAGSVEQRIRRLVHNMERLRWLPRDLGAKHVFVNSAAFETQVIEDGEIIWQSKVIVGKPQYQTVFFSDKMDHVVFNPYWGVPGSIIIRDMLPEVRQDPYWFDREGFEVTDLQGRVIPSTSVDWWNIDTQNFPIGVRQPPGPKNALGEIKFMFPNKHAIYLHDTPSKPLFSRSSRAFSNGCVRVEDPWGFAEILLGWDQQRIASTRATSRNLTVTLDHKIPVHLTYFTAWPDETGTVRYYEDVYNRDPLLERAFGTLTLAMR
jgi:L,D-transpeptidase YcbB